MGRMEWGDGRARLPSDGPFAAPRMEPLSLENVLEPCTYAPTYILKDFPIARYQGLQFVSARCRRWLKATLCPRPYPLAIGPARRCTCPSFTPMTIPVSLTWRQTTSASTVSPHYIWKGRWGRGLSEARMRSLKRKVSDTLSPSGLGSINT